ncbi:MAG: DUF4038 domain-containing protein [Pirellulales bacterium]|nr:DUF4038 domain-containing protein [Pirellulales bacterium]
MTKPHFRVAIAVLLVAWTHHSAWGATTQANVPVELLFTAQDRAGDAAHEITLDVVFTAPDGVQRTVPAFWAGGHLWKVRYTSSLTGTHRWKSVCSTDQDTGLHGQEGTLEVTRYDGANPLFLHGPVRVAADGRHFEHADGTPFFWLGDTWWMGLCHRLHWPDEFQQLAAHRRQQGFTVVQLVAGLYPDMYPFDERGANESGFPWEQDYVRIRPEYFDAADQRLRHLIDQGITPCIVGAWGYFLPWMGETRLQAHWRYLIARYGAWPVVWCAAGEANLPWYRAEGFPYDDQATARRWCTILKSIRAVDPWRRPLTIHPTAINSYSARHVVDDEALLDFDFLQTPHDGPGTTAEAAAARTVLQSRAAEPRMPVVNGEASYEMLLDRIPAAKTRAMFWLCMTGGAAGHTYGANGIWQVNRRGQPHGPSPTAGSSPNGYGTIAWDEAMQLPGGRQIAAGKRWLELLPWHTFAPHATWAAWVEPAADDVPPGAFGLTKGPRVVYLLHNKAVYLRQLEPQRTYRVQHFDPETTAESPGADVTADRAGTVRLEPPTHGHDWVVLLAPADESKPTTSTDSGRASGS